MDKLLSLSERTSWTKTTLREQTGEVTRPGRHDCTFTQSLLTSESLNLNVLSTHLVCPAQRCASQTPHLVSVSAPMMWFCIQSPDIQVWCALPGKENCCGRVSQTSTGQQDQPAGATCPHIETERNKEKVCTKGLKQNFGSVIVLRY